jgi:hypothetical protein
VVEIEHGALRKNSSLVGAGRQAQDTSEDECSACNVRRVQLMATPHSIEPIVGDWYRSHGQLFEVVAIDERDDIVEIQHADGDLEEIDIDDWYTRCRAGSLATSDPPEDLRVGTEQEDSGDFGAAASTMDEIRGLRADALQDLDLFD